MAARDLNEQSVDDVILTLAAAEDATRANPYPLYERMRRDPVHRAVTGFWFVSSYATCDRVMRNPVFRRRHKGSWELRAALQGATGRRWWEGQDRWMLWLDPPDHGRVRGLVSRAFTPRYVAAMRGRVAEVVDGLVDRLVEEGDADFVQSFALPLPITVICEMLGIPEADRRDFRAWTQAGAAVMQPLPRPEVQDAADTATDAVEAYIADLIEARRRSPGDDLLTAMIAAEEDGERLTRDELVANAFLLLAAGFETTTNLLGNGLLALLGNRDQWQKLVADPSLAADATEELLRYDSPVQFAGPHVATEPVEIAGQIIPEAEMVVAVVGSGNRDPRRFDDPDRLDIERPDPSPLSFGAGPHFCLGAALARMEGAVAFETLARRLPDLALAEGDPPGCRA